MITQRVLRTWFSNPQQKKYFSMFLIFPACATLDSILNQDNRA